MDEADQFYANPVAWLQENLHGGAEDLVSGQLIDNSESTGAEFDDSRVRRWPSIIITFAQLEDIISQTLHRKGYEQCWRTFNSHWHDDWRRNGDVILWCLKNPKF